MMKTDDINDQAITKDKIRDGNVTAEKLADGAIKTPKIADKNITTDKLAEGAVTSSKLDNGSVTEEKLDDLSVTNEKLDFSSVSYDKLQDGAVITRKIKDGSVTAEKIADKNVTNEKLAASSVTTEKIKDKNVTNEKLADNSVSNEKIKDKSITNSKLDDNSVDGRNLSNSSIENRHIVKNAVSTSKIASRSVTNEKIAYNSVSRKELTPYLRSSIDNKADSEQVNNSLYNLEKKIGDRFVIEGDVTNLPDEEDLTSVKESERNVLKLADRSYAPYNFSGKGYKILRRNIKQVSIAVTKISVESAPSSDGTLSFTINGKETHILVSASTDNTTALVAKKVASAFQESMTEYEVSVDASLITLTKKSGGSVTQSVFSASTTGVVCTVTDSTKRELRNILTQDMINQPNTIYEIRYRFDLLHDTVSLPTNCILKFEGGELYNGTIKGENTYIEIGKNYPCLFCDFEGSFCTEVIKAEWFDIIPNGDGTVSNTINQHDKFEKLNNYINCTTTVELHFKSGFYGFGGGSDTNKYVSPEAKWNNYYAIHIKKDTKCSSLVIKGNGAKFVNVFPMKVGTWNDDWTPKCKNKTEWDAIPDSDKWKISSHGGGFLICVNNTKDITIRIQDLSVDMHREIFIFGGYQFYTCNQTTVLFHSFGNLYMDNCHFKGNVCDGALVLSSLGFYPKNIVATNCIFEDNIRCGFGCDGGLNILIKGCKFINNGRIYIPNGNTYYKFESPYIAFSVEANIYGNSNIEDFYMEDCYFENNNMGCIAVPNGNVRSVTIDKCIANNTKPTLLYKGDEIMEYKYKLCYFAVVYAEEKVSITNCTLNNVYFASEAVIHSPINESTEGKAEGDLYWNEIQPSEAIVDNIVINCSHLDSLPTDSIILIDLSSPLYNYKVVSGKWTQFIATKHQGGCGKVNFGTIIVNIRNGYRVLYRSDELGLAAPVFINNAIINFLEPITQESFYFNSNRKGAFNNLTICDYNCQETTPYQLSVPSANNLIVHQFGTKQSIKFNGDISINGVSTDLNNFPPKQLSYLIGALGYTKFIHGGYIHNNIIEGYNKKDYGVNAIVSTVPYTGGGIGSASTVFYRRMNFSSPWETLYGNFTHGYNKSWCADVNTLKAELETMGYSKTGSILAAGDICYDISNKQLILGNNSRTDFYRYDGNPYGIAESGTSSQRPTGVKIGTMYFDTSLDTPRPIYWSGSKWVDATGADV